jgi:hypothetical protein
LTDGERASGYACDGGLGCSLDGTHADVDWFLFLISPR